jgi:hypothetical protein
MPITHRRSKNGGGFLASLGTVLNQGIVPFSLLAAQQTYRRKKHKGGKNTKRRNKGKGSRRHRRTRRHH